MASPNKRGLAARSPQDILGGIFLMLIAALALYLVKDLPAAGRVGFASGTAPRLFAWGLMGLGAYIAVIGFITEGPALERFRLRGLATILGAVVFFAISIRYLGLVLTGVPMVLIASLAAEDMRWIESIVFGAAITGFCYVLFPKVLGQPIPAWPQF